MHLPHVRIDHHLTKSNDRDDLLVVGWREWVALPELGLDKIQAKLDSGATYCSLHATHLQEFSRCKETWIRFQLGMSDGVEVCSARLAGYRRIRSSNGIVEARPTIESMLYLGGYLWPIDITLTDRSSLECKLLIGRSAIAGRCLVDCGRTHLLRR